MEVIVMIDFCIYIRNKLFSYFNLSTGLPQIKKEPNELLFLSENLFRLTFQITLPC